MTIHFYIDNEEETELFSLYEQFIAPFKVGDEIKLNVCDLVPNDYVKGNDAFNENIKKENDKLKKECHLLIAKIVKMRNYAKFSVLDNSITVEYHCEIVEDYDIE